MSSMETSSRCAETLALLVGSNPLPNYLAAVILDPREAVLIYTPETKGPRDHLHAPTSEWWADLLPKTGSNPANLRIPLIESRRRRRR